MGSFYGSAYLNDLYVREPFFLCASSLLSVNIFSVVSGLRNGWRVAGTGAITKLVLFAS